MTQRHPIVSDRILMVTSNTAKRRQYFSNPARAREAVLQLYHTQSVIPFSLYGFVIMPDHIHILLNVPSPKTVSDVMRTYKMGLTFQLGIGPLWQRRFYITVATDPLVQLRYIHNNPVKAGLVGKPEQYPWSSVNKHWDILKLP